jgi:hypothetical protein
LRLFAYLPLLLFFKGILPMDWQSGSSGKVPA